VLSVCRLCVVRHCLCYVHVLSLFCLCVVCVSMCGPALSICELSVSVVNVCNFHLPKVGLKDSTDITF